MSLTPVMMQIRCTSLQQNTLKVTRLAVVHLSLPSLPHPSDISIVLLCSPTVSPLSSWPDSNISLSSTSLFLKHLVPWFPEFPPHSLGFCLLHQLFPRLPCQLLFTPRCLGPRVAQGSILGPLPCLHSSVMSSGFVLLNTVYCIVFNSKLHPLCPIF